MFEWLNSSFLERFSPNVKVEELGLGACLILKFGLCEGKRKMWERMKDDESDAPCLTAVCLTHSAHITLPLFSHTGLREASHGHLETRRLATSQFIKNKQKTACFLRN